MKREITNVSRELEKAQAIEIPLQVPRGCGHVRLRLDAVFPGPLAVEASELAQHAAEPAIENAEKAALFAIDLGAHLAEKSQRRGFQCIAGNQVDGFAHLRGSKAAPAYRAGRTIVRLRWRKARAQEGKQRTRAGTTKVTLCLLARSVPAYAASASNVLSPKPPVRN